MQLSTPHAFSVTTSADYVDYGLYVGYVAIYTGRAYKRPGAASIVIPTNDIARRLMWQTMPSIETKAVVTAGVRVTVKLDLYITGVLTDTVTYYYDQCYDTSYDVTTSGGAAPVNGIVDRRQSIVYTPYKAAAMTATVTRQNGTTTTQSFASSSDMNRNLVLPLWASALANAAKVTLGGATYYVRDTCARWALYYLNALGGWDTLVMQGRPRETDRITRRTDQVLDGLTERSRNWANDWTKVLTLNTGLLSDDEAARMHHLLESTDVWLCDLTTRAMHPAVLTASECRYRTLATEGSPVSYDVEVEYAVGRTRR